MDDFEIELKKDFLQEAKDLVESTEKSFLELEKDPSNSTLLDSIFRFAHNLKGTSRAVGFGQIAELTHKAENLLLDIKQGKLQVNDRVVSVLLIFNDKVKEMIEGLSENIEAEFDFADLLSQLENINSNPSSEEVKIEAVSSDTSNQVEEILNADDISEDVVAPSADNNEWEDVTEEEAAPQKEVIEAAATAKVLPLQPVAVDKKDELAKKEIKKESKKEDETIRVSLNRLEKLNDMVGELVILQSLVEGHLIKSGETKTARSLGKLCNNIQDLSMSLRMVPVGPTFQKLTRIVRDTSKLLGKKVDLRLIGEETEIDKTVVESLGDPLVHIIRNAIDHGVETPQERVAAGKSEEGIVEVMAFHEGNFLVIQITDDGKGIKGEVLIEKAKAKGIIPQNANLSVQQGIELIFHAGFSTKETVSEVSGRGVGMDVVKTNIEALGGEVKIRSIPGKGSCFRLMLPLTLAIIEGMLVESSGQRFIIPKVQVQEIIRLDKKNITMHTGRNPYYSLRGDVIPVFYLDADMGTGKNKDCEISLVVKQGNLAFAVGINDIIRQQQVVVKPPTKELLGKIGIMGTTILGDGKPAIIVDLLDLYMKRLKRELQNNEAIAV